MKWKTDNQSCEFYSVIENKSERDNRNEIHNGFETNAVAVGSAYHGHRFLLTSHDLHTCRIKKAIPTFN